MKHHNPNGYFDNNANLKMTHSSLLNVLRWKLQSKPVKRVQSPIEDHTHVLQSEDDYAVWIGHATFLIKLNGKTVLTDPHFSKRASPFQWAGPKRSTPPALKLENLPTIDVVVISHDHYDHLDKHSILKISEKQSQNPPLFMVPLKLGNWLSKHGIKNWIELDWWQSYEWNDLTFHAVPVQHFSGRSLKQNTTLWAGWIIQSNVNDQDKKIFFAGDTGYSDDFKEIGDKFGPIDLSLIPIGAYAPRWFMQEMHVNPEEAVKIHQDVLSKKSIAMHWGAFVLTDEPMDEPPKQLEQAKTKLNIPKEDFIVVKHGAITKITETSNNSGRATNSQSSSLTEVIDQFNDSFSSQNLVEVMSYFAEDAEYTELGGRVAKGKSKIQQSFQRLFDGAYGKVTFISKHVVVNESTKEASFAWTCQHEIKELPDGFINKALCIGLRLVYGKTFHWEGIDYFSFDQNNRITQKKSYGNVATPKFIRGSYN